MIVVAAATAKELRAALGFLSEVPDLVQGCEVPFRLDGFDLLLCVSGLGVVNAALAAGRALAREGVQGLVNVGVAGSFDLRALPLGSPVLVRQEIWPEFGLLGEAGLDPRGLGFAQGRVEGEPVFDRLELAPRAAAKRLGLFASIHWAEAVSLTVSSVTGTGERAGSLARDYGADIENMEGFAMAYGAAQAGLPFVELRCVSNLVGSRESRDWDLALALDMLGKACAALFMGL